MTPFRYVKLCFPGATITQLPGMFLILDRPVTYWIMRFIMDLLRIRFTFSSNRLKYSAGAISGFVANCLCGVWCHGWTRGRLSIKMSSCQYRDPHVKDKMGITIPGKYVIFIETGPRCLLNVCPTFGNPIVNNNWSVSVWHSGNWLLLHLLLFTHTRTYM